MSSKDGTSAGFVARCLAHESASAELSTHRLDFLPAGPVLVVTFEPAITEGLDTNLDRPAWGQGLIARRGHSLLGVKRTANDWYRAADLHGLMRALQAAGFFARFAKVVFYGPSMGGYAALTFADCAPGCTVLAMHPQSCLAPERVWFDQRFSGRRAHLWSGDFLDGAEGAARAARVYVCFDPWQIKDRLHAQRLPAHNRIELRLPFVGHATSQMLMATGKLGEVFDLAVAGSLDATAFKRIARARTRWPDYFANLAARGLHLPRRLKLLDRALGIDPSHAGALSLLQRLAPDRLPQGAKTRKQQGPARGARQRPRRWPTGLVTAERVPLVYLEIPGVCGTTVRAHLQYVARGRYPGRSGDPALNDGLLRSSEDSDDIHEAITRRIDNGALVFAFIREPAERLLMCFAEIFTHAAPSGMAGPREVLSRDWGLRFPMAVDAAPNLSAFQQNFERFVTFVEAHLDHRSAGAPDAPWSTQASMIGVYREYLHIDLLCRQEHFEADMAQVLHRAKLHRAPDVRLQSHPCASPPFELGQIANLALRRRIERIYDADYEKFHFARPSQTAESAPAV